MVPGFPWRLITKTPTLQRQAQESAARQTVSAPTTSWTGDYDESDPSDINIPERIRPFHKVREIRTSRAMTFRR